MKLFKIIMLCTLLASPVFSHAEGGTGSVGGGRFSETQLKDFMGELVKFFRYPESKELFPEVDAWEKKNNQSFADFVATIEPHVVNHKVYGPYGEERDCVSKVLDGGKRIFECNQEKVPENRLENQPLVYQLETHEAFVHAGIEKPTSPDLPSTYELSSRLGNTQNLSLVTYQKWVPGNSSNYYQPETDPNFVFSCFSNKTLGNIDMFLKDPNIDDPNHHYIEFSYQTEAAVQLFKIISIKKRRRMVEQVLGCLPGFEIIAKSNSADFFGKLISIVIEPAFAFSLNDYVPFSEASASYKMKYPGAFPFKEKGGMICNVNFEHLKKLAK